MKQLRQYKYKIPSKGNLIGIGKITREITLKIALIVTKTIVHLTRAS